MRSLLKLGVLALAASSLWAGPVKFGLSSFVSSLTFSQDGNGDEIVKFADSLGNGTLANFVTAPTIFPTVPPGLLDGLFGSVTGSWKITGNACGLTCALEQPPSVASVLTIRQTATDFVYANLTLESLSSTVSSAGVRANFLLNLGPWSTQGTITNAGLLELISTPKANATFSFTLGPGETLANIVASNNFRTSFSGTIDSTVPEPGFYGILAGSLGSLIWAFRRRKTEVA